MFYSALAGDQPPWACTASPSVGRLLPLSNTSRTSPRRAVLHRPWTVARRCAANGNSVPVRDLDLHRRVTGRPCGWFTQAKQTLFPTVHRIPTGRCSPHSTHIDEPKNMAKRMVGALERRLGWALAQARDLPNAKHHGGPGRATFGRCAALRRVGNRGAVRDLAHVVARRKIYRAPGAVRPRLGPHRSVPAPPHRLVPRTAFQTHGEVHIRVSELSVPRLHGYPGVGGQCCVFTMSSSRGPWPLSSLVQCLCAFCQ